MVIPLFALLATVSFGAPTVTASTTQTVSSSQIIANTPQSLEEYVENYFSEDPILAEIARCESRFRHLDSSGDLIRGKVNSFDVGVMQINTMYHEETAGKLGFNLHTLEGNLAYAKYLYEKEGTTPWLSSSACWGKKVKKAAPVLTVAMK